MARRRTSGQPESKREDNYVDIERVALIRNLEAVDRKALWLAT